MSELAKRFLSLAAMFAFGMRTSARAPAQELERDTNAAKISSGPVAELSPQLSPGGEMIAFEYFQVDRPNVPQIWVMDRRGGFESARPLVDNSNYNAEFSWSPDGQWICYINHSLSDHPITSQIFKVRVSD